MEGSYSSRVVRETFRRKIILQFYVLSFTFGL